MVLPLLSLAGAGRSPASTVVSKPAGKTTVTVLPGVESEAKAQTGKDTRLEPMRRSRVASPPPSTRSKRSVYVADLPANSRAPRFRRRIATLALRRLTETLGSPDPPVRRRPVAPGRTARNAVSK